MADVAPPPAADPNAPPTQPPSKVPSKAVSVAAENPQAEGAPTEAVSGESATEAPPAADGDGTSQVQASVSKTMTTTAAAEERLRMENKQRDFFVCIGMLAVIFIACLIGIVVIHFMIKDTLFNGQDGHYTPEETTSDATTTASGIDDTTTAISNSTTEATAPTTLPGPAADPIPAAGP